jgi:hypothetical protein
MFEGTKILRNFGNYSPNKGQYAFCEIGTVVLPLAGYAAESWTINKYIPNEWLFLEGNL